MVDSNVPSCPTCRGAMPSALVAGRVARPAVPATNSRDCGTNNLATAVAAADDFSGPGGPDKTPPIVDHSGDSTDMIDNGQARATAGATESALKRAGAGLSPVATDGTKPGVDYELPPHAVGERMALVSPVVVEYARLHLVYDTAYAEREAYGWKDNPPPDASDEAWTEYAKWSREYRRYSVRVDAAFTATWNFTKANLAALKAAMGVL